MKLKQSILLSLTALLCMPLLAQQQSSDSAEDEGEVIVIADLRLAEVRQFIEEVEEELYSAFNEYNDDDDFDVRCRKETPTGSNIPRRICEPVFSQKSRASNVNDSFLGADVLLSEENVRAKNAPQLRELSEKMQEAAAANPNIAELANILRQLQARQAQLQ